MIYVGIASARLGPAAALIDTDRHAAAACEENRLTRAVDSGTIGPPSLALEELLRFLGRERTDIARTLSIDDPGADPHRAHAAYAFAASGFSDAVVLVCDAHQEKGWTAWQCAASRSGGMPSLEPFAADLPAHEIAAAYSQLTASLGFRPMRDEHLVEALARAGHPQASATQQRLGDELLALLASLKAQSTSRNLCLSGGLFFNTYFTTLATGAFERVYVPPHPGRNGAAIGAALMALEGGAGARDAGAAVTSASGNGHPLRGLDLGSPYLGPGYTHNDIKATLENCKLSFDLLHDDRLFELVLQALGRGRLVGWYHGRLEWGPRALGHRSVLADPFAPHVLENLNGFLKRRPSYRTYGVSVPLADLDRYFERADGGAPEPSPFMQFEYRPKDRDRFRAVLADGVHTLRVHTVDEREPRYLRLLQLWGEKTGTPVLVNTSFNGFHEPLVCSPRDAIRVFYGTGLDVLALESFYLRK